MHPMICKELLILKSKVVSTHLWNTPLNLYQQDMKGFLSWLTKGFAWGVLYGCVVIFLDQAVGSMVDLSKYIWENPSYSKSHDFTHLGVSCASP